VNTVISADDRSRILELADALAMETSPYAGKGEGELCDILQGVLERLLASEATWTGWLDGFVSQQVERLPDRISLRGAIWVNAKRREPCEAVVQLSGEARGSVRLHFMDARGPRAGNPNRRLPTDWLYVYDADA
jgi:hypothetical protein